MVVIYLTITFLKKLSVYREMKKVIFCIGLMFLLLCSGPVVLKQGKTDNLPVRNKTKTGRIETINPIEPIKPIEDPITPVFRDVC